MVPIIKTVDAATTIARLDEKHCPYCPAGPFRHVLSHVWQRHGISADEVKIYCELPLTASFCDEQVSRTLRDAEMARRRQDPSRAERIERTNLGNRIAGAASTYARLKSKPTTAQREAARLMSRRMALAAAIPLDRLEQLAIECGVPVTYDAEG